jgi:hypothetical protein
MKTQVQKYHTFFSDHLGVDNITQSVFQLDGTGASGGGSTALTGKFAVGALASDAPNKATFVRNLWGVAQQYGEWRYDEEGVYLLALLHVSGKWHFELAAHGCEPWPYRKARHCRRGLVPHK